MRLSTSGLGLNTGIPGQVLGTSDEDPDVIELKSIVGAGGVTVAGGDGVITIAGGSGAAAGLVYPWGNFSYGRPRVVSLENAALAAGATATLLDTTGGPPTPGFIDQVWIGINSSASTVAREASVLSVYVDGETTPSFACPLGSLFMAFWGPTFLSRYLGFSSYGDSGSGYCAHKFPYARCVKVTLANGDPANAVTSFFADVSYKSGSAIDWGWARRLKASYAVARGCAPYSTQTLLGASGAGLFYGLMMNFNGGDGDYQYLEGEFSIYIDGESTPSITWSGTEDYFLQGNYFAGGVAASDNVGCTTKGYGGQQVSAYRLHVDDPIPFAQSIAMTWQAGNAARATVTNDVSIWFAALYYLNA